MNQLSDTLNYIPKWVLYVLPILFIILAVIVSLSINRTTLNIKVSESAVEIKINDKPIDFVGKEARIKLRPGKYGVSAIKQGFEPYFRYITVSKDNVTLNITLTPKINQELTGALPTQTNPRGISLKATKVKYLQGNTWAVATMVQFDVEESQTEQTYAVFKKVGGQWTTFLEPASEYFDEETSLSKLPEDVKLELKKRLAE